MLQVLVVYFGPYYAFGWKLGTGYRFPAVILAFVVNYAAYFAEIYRSGIESMPVGQYEAAQVKVMMIPTNEELAIARETVRLVTK